MKVISSAEKAMEAIRSMIISNQLKPGTMLDVAALAGDFGMSITPVRDAIQGLEREGLLEVIPRRGTFVRSFTLEDLVAGYEAAEALEGMASYLCAEQVESDDLQLTDFIEIDVLLARMKPAATQESARPWGLLDTSFHDTLCALCRNERIIQAHQSIRNQMNCVIWFITPVYVDRENSTREHHKIVAAIKSGDKKLARELSQKHRNNVRNLLISLIKK